MTARREIRNRRHFSPDRKNQKKKTVVLKTNTDRENGGERSNGERKLDGGDTKREAVSPGPPFLLRGPT